MKFIKICPFVIEYQRRHFPPVAVTMRLLWFPLEGEVFEQEDFNLWYFKRPFFFLFCRIWPRNSWMLESTSSTCRKSRTFSWNNKIRFGRGLTNISLCKSDAEFAKVWTEFGPVLSGCVHRSCAVQDSGGKTAKTFSWIPWCETMTLFCWQISCAA